MIAQLLLDQGTVPSWYWHTRGFPYSLACRLPPRVSDPPPTKLDWETPGVKHTRPGKHLSPREPWVRRGKVPMALLG